MLPPIFPKKHGMIDARWTTKDQIKQYKGLVKLSERDAKILQTDRHVAERKQTREFHHLKQDIAKHREELTNAIRGDRQHIRNVLGEHEVLRCTIQNSLPEKTLEHLEHKNFNKRKLLDRLNSKTEKKLKELTAQKLTCCELKNVMAPNKTNDESRSEIIAGKIQEATIKLEASLQIKYTYKQILDILKKDKMNFDSVLNQLMKDAGHQSQCIYRATQIGQLAVEYTDDRKQELQLLQQAIQRDMKSRFLQLDVTEKQVKELHDSLKLLVRKESTVKLDQVPHEVTVENQMKQDLQSLEKTLQDVQNITYTTKFKGILSCLQDQQHKTQQMSSLLLKSVSEKETLLNKIKHAKSVHSHLTNTTEYSTFEYMERKAKLKQSFKDTYTKIQKLKTTLEEKSNIVTKIRSILLHFQQLCRIINKPNKSKEPNKMLQVQIAESVSDKIIYAPQQLEMDALKTIADLETRLSILMNANDQDQIQNFIDADGNAEKHFQKFIAHICRNVPMDDNHTYDALILELEPNNRNVLTREVIKKESQRLVERNAKPEWML